MTSFNSENRSLLRQHEARLRHLEPLNAAIVEQLGPAADGARLLDLCCGIGEPTVLLARTHPSARVVGTDIDDAALELARERARAAGLANVSFEMTDALAMSYPDASFDGAVSRLGVLLFGDMDHAALELARVLRPGAPYVLAMWSEAADNPYMRCGIAAVETIAGTLTAAGLPDVRERVSARGSWDVLSSCLARAGFSSAHTRLVDWTTDVPNFDAVWDYCTTAGPLDDFYAGLDDADRDRARQIIVDQAGSPHGSGWRIRSRCRLVYGRR